MKPENLKLCPKSAKLTPNQGTIRESRKFLANSKARLELQVLSLESEYPCRELTGNPGPYRAVTSLTEQVFASIKLYKSFSAASRPVPVLDGLVTRSS